MKDNRRINSRIISQQCSIRRRNTRSTSKSSLGVSAYPLWLFVVLGATTKIIIRIQGFVLPPARGILLQSQLHSSKTKINKFVLVEEDDDEEGDEKEEWLSWMSSGMRLKRYSYDEVKMREDERLGGLPR